MITDTRTWQKLTPETIARLPEAGAVFEVANLVRSVVFIGRASGNLRRDLGAYHQESLKQRPVPGGYFFRYEPTAREEEALEGRLGAYRKTHGGLLPAGNCETPVPLRVATRRAA